jgi:hypothetical protein
MILKLSNPLIIPQILDLAKLVPDAKYEVLRDLLISGINDPDSMIYYDEKDGVVNGFILGSKEMWNGNLVCFVQFCVISPSREDKYIGFELLTKARLWSKEKGLNEIVTSVKRDPKGFIRKYHFEMDGYILKRMV